MDEAVARRRVATTFNGPLEAGVRAVAVLAAAHPRSFDLQRLIAFDYLLVHTGDIGGPDSLHPPVPLHSAELLVRRKLVEQALLLMMTRHLVRREVSADGIRYRAGENATPFLQALQSDYLGALKKRADWLVEALGARSETEFREIMRQFFDSWVEEFQTAERSLGADS
jgi:hypothetical protein